MSCPHQNINWRVRSVGSEIMHASRPHWDEAWFILGLVALTLFHGLTMMPYWEDWIRQLAMLIGDSGQLLVSFSIGMVAGMAVPLLLFAFVIWITFGMLNGKEEYRRIFSSLAFAALPLAFSYHLAHNLNHLVRESHGFWSVVFNPVGKDTLPLSMAELHYRHMHPLVSDNLVFVLQGMLVVFGFWLAVNIARHRLQRIAPGGPQIRLLMPIFSFICLFTLASVWLLMQPMVMRM